MGEGVAVVGGIMETQTSCLKEGMRSHELLLAHMSPLSTKEQGKGVGTVCKVRMCAWREVVEWRPPV